MKSKRHKIIFVLAILVNLGLGFAAYNKDSLLHIVKVAKHDSVIVKAYTELIHLESSQLNKEADFYQSQINKLLIKNSRDPWFTHSYSIARTLNILGNHESVVNRPGSAINYYVKALAIYEKGNRETNKSFIYIVRSCIATLYMRVYDVAMVKFYCAPIRQELGNQNFDSLSSDYQMTLMACNNLLAAAYSREKDHKKAIEILTTNLKLMDKAKEVSDMKQRFYCIANMLLSISYLSLNENEKAITYALAAYKEVRAKKFSEYIIGTSNYLGKAYLKAGNTKLAEKYLLEFDSLVDAANPLFKYNDLSALIELYEKLNKPDKVNFYLKKQIVLKDSSYAYNLRQNLTETKEKYETEKRELKLTELENQHSIQRLEFEKQKNYSNFIVIIAIAIALIAIALLFIVLIVTKNLKKIKQQKEVINEQKLVVERKSQIIEDALIEKNVLLKEINHRVKNNLTIIVGLLEIQSFTIKEKDVRVLFTNASNRIRTMAEIHQHLFSNDTLSQIDLHKFIKDLATQMSHLFDKPLVEINFAIDKVYFSVDTANNIGLIINELFTNSFKHAVVENKPLKIEIEVTNSSSDGVYCLNFKDNGNGIQDDLSKHLNKSMGLRLIKLLSKQLGGDLSYSYSDGSIFSITFKEAKLTKVGL